TKLSTLEALKGLILKIPGEIALAFFITFDYVGVGTEFEVTGFDKACDSSILGIALDIGRGVTTYSFSLEEEGRKRKHMELEPEVKVPGSKSNMSLPKGVPFAKNMVIEEPEYEIFFTDVFGDLAEIKEVNANCILMANLQQASTSDTQTDKAPYTKLLEPIPEPHKAPQNNSNVISMISSVEQSRGTVEQHLATIEETRACFESLYNNLAIEVEKVNTVNCKMKETNVDLTTELARYKNQEKSLKSI
nr:hypothetical protein [Tanacetum cinerariifolium]